MKWLGNLLPDENRLSTCDDGTGAVNDDSRICKVYRFFKLTYTYFQGIGQVITCDVVIETIKS